METIFTELKLFFYKKFFLVRNWLEILILYKKISIINSINNSIIIASGIDIS